MPNSDETEAKSVLTDAVTKEQESLLSVIFNAIADVTFVLNVEADGRYRFIFINKAFEKRTGLPPEKVVGHYVSEVISEPLLSLVLTKYRETVTTGARVVWQKTTDFPTGRVTKYRSAAQPLRITLESNVASTGETTIVVDDNGSGFDLEWAGSDVFQLYRRFHASNAGRGIGLYLVKTHVEDMEGQISVRSQPGEGTQFTLYFRTRPDENLPD